jgi:hypothetical protein
MDETCGAEMKEPTKNIFSTKPMRIIAEKDVMKVDRISVLVSGEGGVCCPHAS